MLACVALSRIMTSSNGNIFRVTGPLCGEFTDDRWIPRTKASDAGLWCFSFISAWTNGWANNGDAGDLRRHRAHYDVIVMGIQLIGRLTFPLLKQRFYVIISLSSRHILLGTTSIKIGVFLWSTSVAVWSLINAYTHLKNGCHIPAYCR